MGSQSLAHDMIRALAQAWAASNDVDFAKALILSPRDGLWEGLQSEIKAAELEWKLADAAYVEGSKVFGVGGGGGDVGWLGRGMRKMAENLLHLAFRSAHLSRDKRFTAPSKSVDKVRRTFQICTQSEHSMPGDAVPKRGDMTFALGNICWRVYDQLQTYRLLDTISQMYLTIRPSPQARLEAPCTSKAEEVAFWFWAGKLKLAKGDVRRAKDDLEMAFLKCPVKARRNLKAITIRLMTCQILLGSFPSPLLLDYFNLHGPFSPLIQAIKDGDRAGYYRQFEEWGEWFRRRGVWLVLREKGEVLVWRGLFRNTFRIWQGSQPPSTARSRSIPTSIFLTAMEFSMHQCGETNVGPEDLISIMASLIDQSYIRAHISNTFLQIVASNNPQAPVQTIFPRVAAVRARNAQGIAAGGGRGGGSGFRG